MTGLIEKQQLDNIATWMTSVKPTQLPAVLKGVFFMDGNPLPDDCITMYNLDWDEQNLTLAIPVSAPVQWTYHQSILGWLLLRAAQLARFTYKIKFEDQTLKQAQIIPFAFGLPIPRWIVNATMSQDGNQNGDIWQRKNVWLGVIPRIGEYTLRRIVDGNGQYTPAFQDMLTKVQNDCLVVARPESVEA